MRAHPLARTEARRGALSSEQNVGGESLSTAGMVSARNGIERARIIGRQMANPRGVRA